MSGVTLNVKIEDHGVQKMLDTLSERMSDLKPAMSIIGSIVRASIVRNFEKEGRPKAWTAHSDLTIAARGKGAKILSNQGFAGGLKGSIHPKPYHDKVVIGTNKIYAAVHHFGAKKGSFGIFTANIREHLRKVKSGKSFKVKAHTRKMALPWGDIPKRPYMMVQDEDWPEIRAELSEYIMRGGKS